MASYTGAQGNTGTWEERRARMTGLTGGFGIIELSAAERRCRGLGAVQGELLRRCRRTSAGLVTISGGGSSFLSSSFPPPLFPSSWSRRLEWGSPGGSRD